MNAELDAQDARLSRGIETMMRATFAKGYHYTNEEAITNVADTLANYNPEMKKALNTYKENEIKIKDIKATLLSAKRAEIYLPKCQVLKLKSDLLRIETEHAQRRSEIMNFIVKTMEAKKVLEKPYTYLTLKKIPLTLKGVRPSVETEEDIDEDLEEDYEY